MKAEILIGIKVSPAVWFSDDPRPSRVFQGALAFDGNPHTHFACGPDQMQFIKEMFQEFRTLLQKRVITSYSLVNGERVRFSNMERVPCDEVPGWDPPISKI